MVKYLLFMTFLLSLVSCPSPVSNPTTYSPGPAVSGLPLGLGLTVYAGFVDQSPSGDYYHTGLMVYPNGGNTWTQLLPSGTGTVNDINIDSSGNIAVAEPNEVMYCQKSSGAWTSLAATGTVNQGALDGTGNYYAATTSGFLKYSVPLGAAATSVSFSDRGGDTNATSLLVTGPAAGYLGTATGLFSFSGTTTTPLGQSGKAVFSSYINGISSNVTGLNVADSFGYSFSSAPATGSSWVDTLSGTLGMGSVLCVFADSSNNLYLGTSTGVVYQPASGQGWTQTLGTPVTSITAAVAGGETSIYAATPQGLFIYTSGTSTVSQGWQVIFQGYPVNKVYVTVP